MTATQAGISYNRTELVWAGKRTQVDRIALPFQRVETINAPRGGDRFSALEDGGGWRNKLIWGDNKLVMASLLRGDPDAGGESLAGTIDLIYIDPHRAAATSSIVFIPPAQYPSAASAARLRMNVSRS